MPADRRSQAATGLDYIDGILSGWAWDGPIVFSMPNAASQYDGPTTDDGYPRTVNFDPDGAAGPLPPIKVTVDETTGLVPLTGDFFTRGSQVWAVYEVLGTVSALTNLGVSGNALFPEVGDIKVAMTSTPGPAGTIQNPNTDQWTAYAPYPGLDRRGDVWLNTEDYNVPLPGTYAFHTFLHEIGHALGLKHGHEFDTRYGDQINAVLPVGWDSQEFTVMTYREYEGDPTATTYGIPSGHFPQTYMMLDIYALQTMYGADYGWNNTNTVYTFDPVTGQMFINGNPQGVPQAYNDPDTPGPDVASNSNVLFRTIWDGGGIDTYDFSNFDNSFDMRIDLRPGGWTDVDADSNRLAANIGGSYGAPGALGYARGQVFNALQWGTNTDSLIENAIGGTGNDAISGNQKNNTLRGNIGNDTLFGWEGNDILDGGRGNDLLYGDIGNDTLRSGAGADTLDGGNDTDRADYSASDAAIEIDRVTGIAAGGHAAGDVLISIESYAGSDFADTIRGNDGAERMDGGNGADLLEGRGGDDSLFGNAGNDTLIGGQGADLLNGVEGLDTALFTGPGPVSLNFLTGVHTGEAAGDIYLSVERFVGTDGNDTMIGDSQSLEFSGGKGNDQLDGGAGLDVLNGNEGDDILWGGSGEDTLRGGAGADAMDGGPGADMVSYVDAPAAVFLDLGWFNGVFVAGRVTGGDSGDVFQSIEDGEGSAYNDTLWGVAGQSNKLLGNIGNDVIDGKGGADLLYGGEDNDLVYAYGGDWVADGGFGGFDTIAAAGGDAYFDWISNLFYVGNVQILQVLNFEAAQGGNGLDFFRANGENLSFYAGGGTDTLTGGNGDNVLEGGAGADRLTFGGGFDYADYRSDTAGVLADIRSGLVGNAWAAVSHAQGDFWTDSPEGLMGGAGNDRFGGSDGDNRILGRGGNDYISGYGGNDTLEGGDDADSIEGGLGADFILGGEGNDAIVDTEGLLLFTGAEDNADDQMFGGGGNDTVTAGGGNDTLQGDDGNDVLSGGAGDDSITGGAGNDSIDGGTGAGDVARFAGNRSDYLTSALAGGGIQVADLRGGAPTGTDSVFGVEIFRFNDGDVALSAILSMVPTIGPDSLAGTAGPDTIDGLAGNDTVDGLDSDDLLQGGADNDSLLGGIGNDTLAGGAGSDTLAGGEGDDTYLSDGSDVIVEAPGGGIDTLSTGTAATLAAEVENLVLTGAADVNGTGNGIANAITGNAGANALFGLQGNDTLDGSAGADTLYGGKNNDTYIVDDAGDLVVEIAGQGTDQVLASVSYTLPDAVEVLVLTGAAAINGTGNGLNNVITGNAAGNYLTGGDGSDTLNGGDGADVLDGGEGIDRLNGGRGADIYIVTAGDIVSEAGGDGIDTVVSEGSFVLPTAVEWLFLVGAAAADGTGNTSNNLLGGNGAANRLDGASGNDTIDGADGNDTLLGGAGNDSLTAGDAADLVQGGAGKDTLSGGLGADIFRYDAPSEGLDLILDFEIGVDKVQINASAFGGGLTSATDLAAEQRFISNISGKANLALGQFVYETDAGRLWWDADGTGAGARVLVASLQGNPAFAVTDILLL